ncbi:ATP-dependent bile acid permease [Fusarium longipes]|uniref:ATP-dependent bile acid permease n=1 Tax=Fusarium longipes TaxID=694270 RepID=A0A395RUZ8_9HYPO|nr:ATP-dependent bile acid permease [Fusarium longipes]
MSQILSSATLAISLLSCSIALQSSFRQLRHGEAKDQFYQDDDGCASPRALAEFTNRGPKSFIIALSVIGTGTSIASLVITLIHIENAQLIIEPTLTLATWALASIHGLCIVYQHSPVRAQRFGVWLLFTAVALAASSLLNLGQLYTHSRQLPISALILSIISTVFAISLAFASTCLPRRPEVLHQNAAIDRQWTVSVLGRLTWTWVQPILRHAAQRGDIDTEDVPKADSRLRSQDLKKRWDQMAQKDSLFRSLVALYKGRLFCLWAITLIRCAVSILPFWFMLKIINVLEDGAAPSDKVELMSYVLCMALSNLLDSWMECWAYWYSLESLVLPIRSQISGLIFGKVLLRKDIRTVGSDESTSETEDISEEDTTSLKSHQAIINLVGIDTERLSYFLQYHFHIITSVIKLIAFSIFLLRIIGWLPLVTGIMAWALTLPLNTWSSSKVLVQSRTLMRHRDIKLSKISEVLTGLQLVTLGLDSLVSLKRISVYLEEPDKQTELTMSDTISFHNASVAWPSATTQEEGAFALSDLRLSFPNHALSVVSGKVGAGKTLLLSAILGEADLLSGSIHVPRIQQFESSDWIIPGSIAYVSQTPWLENCSLRENILFGLPMDKTRYAKVLEACALSEDLKSLQDGDDTEIGANGVNLSGGQKWRVTLARAVYSRAEILLMEDIFSAVDSHVGAWIYDKCLTGDICRGRTLIIVTHHVSLVMTGASFLVELGDGGVLYSGLPNLSAHEGSNGSDTGTVNAVDLVDCSHDDLVSAVESETVPLRIWTARSSVEANSRITSQHVLGSTFSTTELLSRQNTHTAPNPNVIFYLKIYIAISVATAIIGVLRYLSSYFLAVKASRSLFEKMLFSVMHAPLRWLDTVHTGRILNRFTADFNMIDERIAMTWSQFFSHLLRLVGICVASCFASAYLIPPAALILSIGAAIGSQYLVTSRPLKRLESNAKSPVFELSNTTLAGISTIRAFRRTQTYLEQMHNSLNAWAMTTFYIALANRWMSLRMALITALFSITVGIVIVVEQIDAALAGLALSFVLDFSESLRWTIRSYGDMELEMNSMERVVEYTNIETEYLGGLRPASAWPSSGGIAVKDLEVAYAPDLPPVLKGLSFEIKHGERVGVVGRTGAGKSSMTLALFRFLEARSGSIAIDGVDISKLKLTDLRSKMSIIPQHPVLFSGTVRSNLDPFGEYTDVQLHEALTRVHIVGQHDASSMFYDLSSLISESSSNLSQGQQQLLCMARALLAASTIIVLDEATSAIDIATDVLIQKSIREWFTDRTMLVIAHRLSTVADFDKVLVLDGGRMVEFGTPGELWEKDGVFRGMCRRTGASEEENLRRVIMGHHGLTLS